MILIYPLLTISRNDYAELRYSIRSICQVHDVSRVILIGGLPTWFNGEHIPFKDYGVVRKEENIFHKVKYGLEYIGPTDDPVMFCNDDHFLLAPIELYHRGIMSATCAKRVPNTSYSITLRNTLHKLGDHINDYDTHCPMVVSLDGIGRVDNTSWPQWGYGFKTMYVYANGLTGTEYPDMKLQDIPNIKPARTYFSTHDGVTNLKRVEGWWPVKSKFEL